MTTFVIQVTDAQHLLAMGEARGLEAALAVVEAERDPLTPAVERLRRRIADQDMRVMQHSVRLAAWHGIDLNTNDITWDGGDHIVAVPHGAPNDIRHA